MRWRRPEGNAKTGFRQVAFKTGQNGECARRGERGSPRPPTQDFVKGRSAERFATNAAADRVRIVPNFSVARLQNCYQATE